MESGNTIKKNQIEVISLAESFFQSSVLFALVKLKIFERIGNESKSLGELAAELGTQPKTLVRLMNAGVVLKLLEYEEEKGYRVAPICKTILTSPDDERYLGSWVRNMDFFRTVLSKLDEAILTSKPTIDPSTHVGGNKENTREFAMAMHNVASIHGKELAHFLDTSKSSTLLDLGCGPGTYAFHLGNKNPKLKLYLIDRPEILEVAKDIQNKYHINNEVHYMPLDAIEDEIPGTYDIILISNTLHMLGEQASRKLIKRLYKSINRGGSLVIQARFLNCQCCDFKKHLCLKSTDQNRPLQVHHKTGKSPVLLDLVQLCATSEGRNHYVCETRTWLGETGFVNIEYCTMTLLDTNSFLRAYKA
jgi:SAM-dependent methyltransferase